jgi:RNA polymerase sigma factor (sigma-70 family)
MTSPAALSDAQLVERCRAGDEAAWHELVERFSRFVYAIAVRAFRLSHHDADDVFQDVFAKAYQNVGRLRDDDALRPWLAQLTRRTCLDRLRASRPEEALSEEEPDGTEDVLARLDEALTVREALTTLSPDCREILDRFFARDESYRTIGEALELPPGTIASRISRCLSRLRDELQGRNQGVAAS